MIKNAIALLALVSLAQLSHAQQAPKIISVDMETLFREFYEVKAAEAKLESAVSEVRTENEEMEATMLPTREAYDEQVARFRNEALTEDARREAGERARGLEAQLRQASQELGQFQAQQSQTLNQRRASISNQNLTKIREVVSQYAQSQGADMVVNSTNVASFMYVDGLYDRTEAVLAILNADAPAETPTPDPAPEATE